MITGKDKELYKEMGHRLHHAQGLMARIKSDLELISSALKKNGVDVVSEPYWRLFDDIGRCTAQLEDMKDLDV